MWCRRNAIAAPRRPENEKPVLDMLAFMLHSRSCCWFERERDARWEERFPALPISPWLPPLQPHGARRFLFYLENKTKKHRTQKDERYMIFIAARFFSGRNVYRKFLSD